MKNLLRFLFLIPIGIVVAAVVVWVWQTFSPRRVDLDARSVEVERAPVSGVTFEIEFQPWRNNYDAVWGADSVYVKRGQEYLDFMDGLLVVKGMGYPNPKPGDVIRWNLEGPLLVNGEPQSPHPLQPRPLDIAATDLQWSNRGGTAPRDTLSVDWPRSGRVFFAANGDGVVRAWNADSREIQSTLVPDPPEKSDRGRWGLRAAASPDGKTVATANMFSDDVVLWDAATGAKLATLAEPKGKVTAVHFASDDQLLEARGGTLYLRRLLGDRSHVIAMGKVHGEIITPFALSADGRTLARNDGTRVTVSPLVPLPFGQVVAPTLSVIDKVTDSGCVALSPNGELLALFDGTTHLTIHETATGAVKQRMRWRADGSPVYIGAMTFLPDGKTLAVGERSSLRLYDLPTGRERGWIHAPWVRSLALSNDGKMLVVGLQHLPGVRIWETAALEAR